MRSFVFCCLCLLQTIGVGAQAFKDVDKRVTTKVNRKIDQKVDRTIDKVLNKADRETDKPIDDALDQNKSAKKKNDNVQKETAKINEPAPSATSAETQTGSVIKAEGKYDFIPGDKIIFEDAFEKDAIGDFPAAWNTNGSGEVLTLQGIDGKWLSIPHNTLTYPENVSALPENFTVEFDLLYTASNRPPINFGFTESKDPVKEGIRYKKLFYFKFDNARDLVGSSNRAYSGGENNKSFPIKSKAGKVISVSISANKTRIRLYLDQEKIFDLPRSFEPVTLRNKFYFKAAEITSAKEPFYISNVRIAETGTDARSGIIKELMEKGSVSTNDIEFDFNSDKIRTSSHEVINTFGQGLKENPELKIKIIGHTDNVGRDDYNQQLSAKRAEAVKRYLMEQYAIDANRLQTEGKGASAPVQSNDTEVGRAKNRRVEFVKL